VFLTTIRPTLKGAQRDVHCRRRMLPTLMTSSPIPGAKLAASAESQRSVSPRPNSQRPVSFASVVRRNDKSAGLDGIPIHQHMSARSFPLVATAPCLELAKLFQAQSTTCTSLDRCGRPPVTESQIAISVLLLTFVSLIHGTAH
jgi:hypothetical protein